MRKDNRANLVEDLESLGVALFFVLALVIAKLTDGALDGSI